MPANGGRGGPASRWVTSRLHWSWDGLFTARVILSPGPGLTRLSWAVLVCVHGGGGGRGRCRQVGCRHPRFVRPQAGTFAVAPARGLGFLTAWNQVSRSGGPRDRARQHNIVRRMCLVFFQHSWHRAQSPWNFLRDRAVFGYS